MANKTILKDAKKTNLDLKRIHKLHGNLTILIITLLELELNGKSNELND